MKWQTRSSVTAKKMQEVLASERLALWSALRLSISSRFGYFQLVLVFPAGLPAGGLAGQSSPVLHELKVISSSRTWYKPNQAKRAVDGRADLLQGEYERKARAADRRQGVPKGAVGRVEEKLVSLGKIAGIVLGNFGEVSQATHSLLAALASSRVRVAGVTRGERSYWRT